MCVGVRVGELCAEIMKRKGKNNLSSTSLNLNSRGSQVLYGSSNVQTYYLKIFKQREVLIYG